ncbi:MAG: hypothetical protein ACOC22_02075 [bacterium]
MQFDKPIIHTSNPFKGDVGVKINRTIFYGEVISIDDENDGGRIKVRIPGLDNKISNEDLVWAYPMQTRFFHVFPKIGEMVRIILEDRTFPQRSRFWEGPVISQPQKISFDSKYTALSTTNYAVTNPEKAPSTFPDARGVFPQKDDVAIVGRVNTDVILRLNEVHIRAGKHEDGNILNLNTKNPAHLSMIFEPNPNSNEFYSNSILMSDKIALLSHDGKPRLKAARLEPEDREKIFNEGHPLARADVLVEALNLMRRAIINHIHGYNTLPADKFGIITELEEINFDAIMQKNIVIN